MSAAKAGLLGAGVLAGPTLYGMVQAGQLDATQAVLRGGVVAVGVALGASYVLRLVDTYHQQVEAARRKAERDRRRLAAVGDEIDATARHLDAHGGPPVDRPRDHA